MARKPPDDEIETEFRAAGGTYRADPDVQRFLKGQAAQETDPKMKQMFLDNAAKAMAGDGKAKGGLIRKVAGPKVGKDDGMIPAKKGEYVVKKAAVAKLGPNALATINKGKIPAKASSNPRRR